MCIRDSSIEASRFTGPIEEALEEYMEGRAELYISKKKARSLMDMATFCLLYTSYKLMTYLQK